MLDLFAGNNVLWSSIDKTRYYGVELESGKGKNLNADAKRIVRSLDLSAFNVIDCDSYEIPFEVVKSILENPNTQSGTIVLYTAITNAFTQLPNAALDYLGIRKMYKIAPSLFNANAVTYFYDMLASHCVESVQYYELTDGYTKHYGYFRVP